jgi:hypothetical protein
LIFPGLIDLHNHVSWNVIPRWDAGGGFTARDDWRRGAEYYRDQVVSPYDSLIEGGRFCDMNTYGEVRALAGGVTSIVGTRGNACISGLVRNLDFSSGFYSFPDDDSQHIRSDVDFSDNPERIRSQFGDVHFEAYLIHLAEGTNDASRQEFNQLISMGLLDAKTVIVHGTALGDEEFQAMGAAGASLVWSPSSNLALYNATTDIAVALDNGVRVALSPDWAITGSSNMLDELRTAADWNTNQLGGLLSDEQLVAMVTSIPAEIAGIDDMVGAIRPGTYGDLLVISGDAADPYRALVQSNAENVQLVLINGVPLYGDAALMANFWADSELVSVPVLSTSKMLRTTDGFEALQSRLSEALAGVNIELAPVVEVGVLP